MVSRYSARRRRNENSWSEVKGDVSHILAVSGVCERCWSSGGSGTGGRVLVGNWKRIVTGSASMVKRISRVRDFFPSKSTLKSSFMLSRSFSSIA